MPGCADASRPVDAESDVALAADGRLARVDPHAHAERAPVGPCVLGEAALRRERGRHRVLCPTERDEERVPLRVDLVAAVFGERVTQDPLVIGERLAISVSSQLL
jgi:hypothetical protein